MTTRGLQILIFLSLSSLAQGHKYESPLSFLRMHNVRDASEQFSFDVSSRILHKSGDDIVVTWSGVASPSKDDWIGLFCPAKNIDYRSTAPSKYTVLDAVESHLQHGRGSLTFHVVNVRSECAFAFFRNGIEKPTLAKTTTTFTFANPNEPLQGHISLGNRPDEIVVMWTTKDSAHPQVRWRRQGETSFTTANAVSDTYKKEDLCGAPATTVGWMDPGTLHRASVTGLAPGVRYVYQYGSDEHGWSEEVPFTAPVVPGANQNTNIVAFGDMGKGSPDGAKEHWECTPALNTTRLIMNEIDKTDIILHIGDISYAVGYSAQWDEFFDQVTPMARRVPYMTCIGNHERDYLDSGSLFTGTDSGGECGVPYEKRFAFPGAPARDEPWYSFNFGNVHVVMISTEHSFAPGGPQHQFVVHDLEEVDRSVTPWVVFAGHRPMYIDSTDEGTDSSDQNVARQMRADLEPLLEKYSVDMCIWGHHHSYQRSCPVLKEKCVADNYDGSANAPVHVVIGMAGMGLSQNIKKVQPEYFVYVDDHEYGFSRIRTTAGSMTLEFVSDIDGQVRDSVTLKKPSTSPVWI